MVIIQGLTSTHLVAQGYAGAAAPTGTAATQPTLAIGVRIGL